MRMNNYFESNSQEDFKKLPDINGGMRNQRTQIVDDCKNQTYYFIKTHLEMNIIESDRSRNQIGQDDNDDDINSQDRLMFKQKSDINSLEMNYFNQPQMDISRGMSLQTPVEDDNFNQMHQSLLFSQQQSIVQNQNTDNRKDQRQQQSDDEDADDLNGRQQEYYDEEDDGDYQYSPDIQQQKNQSFQQKLQKQQTQQEQLKLNINNVYKQQHDSLNDRSNISKDQYPKSNNLPNMEYQKQQDQESDEDDDERQDDEDDDDLQREDFQIDEPDPNDYQGPNADDPLYKSISIFSVMKQHNQNHLSFDRLTRQPVWKWDPNSEASKTDSSKGITTLGQDPYESQKLRLYSCTWNIHGQLPGIDHLKTLIKAKEIPHDIYVISTQECQRPIASSIFAPSKEKWENLLLEYLGDQFVSVSSFALGATHIIVLVNKILVPIITDVQSDFLATGIKNIVGNKGAVSVSFKVGRTRLLCISCHLASGQGKIERRNQDWKNIYRALVLEKKNQPEVQKNAVAIEEEAELDQDKFDGIIWLGDYNYRINGVVGAITHAIKRDMYEVLLYNDQFGFEHKIGRIGWGFKEGEIQFAPTYKLFKGKDAYNTKERLPGWTDRIIYKSRQTSTNKDVLVQKSYDSNINLRISDHRPVFSQFELNFDFNEHLSTEELQRDISGAQSFDISKFKNMTVTKLQSPSMVKSDRNTHTSLNQFSSGQPMTVKIKKNQVLSMTPDDIQKTIELKKHMERDFNKSKSKGCFIF
eukprot:403357925